MTRGGQTYFFHTNAHGDIISVTDSSKTRVATYNYDPWGKLLSSTGTLGNPFRYSGYYFDTETGLYYLQSRYYSPELCRFLTKDLDSKRAPDIKQLLEPLSLNAYSYCEGNPVKYVDPEGRAKRLSLGQQIVFWGAMLVVCGGMSFAIPFLSPVVGWAFIITGLVVVGIGVVVCYYEARRGRSRKRGSVRCRRV